MSLPARQYTQPLAILEPRRPTKTDELKIDDMWRMLQRNVLLIAACVITCAAAAWVYVHYARPVYEASALFDINGQRSVEFTPNAGPDHDEVSTEMEVLTSRTMAEQVIDHLGLQLSLREPRTLSRNDVISAVAVAQGADSGTYWLVRQPDRRFALQRTKRGTATLATYAPGDTVKTGDFSFLLSPRAAPYSALSFHVQRFSEAVAELGGALRVSRPSAQANLVRLAYSGSDAQLLAATLNSLGRTYMGRRQNVGTTEARERVKFLQGQIATLQLQLTSSEDELQNFRTAGSVVDPKSQGSSQVTRLVDMQAERSKLESERSSLAALLKEVNAAAALPQEPGAPSPYRRLIAFPTLLRNAAASEILRSLSSVEDERAKLLTRRTAADPDVAVLSNRISELEEQLRQIAVTYEEGLRNQVAAEDASMASFSRDLSKIPAQEATYQRLERQPKVLEDMYGMLQTKLKEAEIAAAAVDATVQVVDSAVAPTKPVRPRALLDLAAALVLGAVIGLLLAVAREHLDATVRTREQLQTITEVPVLGLIPRIRVRSTDGRMKRFAAHLKRRVKRERTRVPLVGLTPTGRSSELSKSALAIRKALDMDVESRAGIIEAFGQLQTNIQYVRPDRHVKSIVVTSALPGEGKTTTAVNLALTLAQHGTSVLLIDADLRCGSVASAFDIDIAPGLSELLEGKAALEGVLTRLEVGGMGRLSVIPSGLVPSNPGGVLLSNELRELLEAAEREYDIVIIDSPPLNVVADAAILSGVTQGVVLVARSGVTAKAAITYAAEQLRLVRAPLFGTILNDIEPKSYSSYDGAYRYYGVPALKAYGEQYAMTDTKRE
ncbi:MAG: polysaccharide biosynthesis tyrosine autokinase [Gemmatimonadota bacterium]|nr:polysaccharide biosynthesis tyrosine autokinase [Gemmatimonadota bacterium]